MVRIVASPRMASLTSLHLGGRALALATFESAADLETLPEAADRIGGRVAMLGGGTNILAADGELPVVLVRCGMDEAPAVIGEDGGLRLVRVGAGVKLPRLLVWCMKHGLSGLEGMAGVPGGVGGAVAVSVNTVKTSALIHEGTTLAIGGELNVEAESFAHFGTKADASGNLRAGNTGVGAGIAVGVSGADTNAGIADGTTLKNAADSAAKTIDLDGLRVIAQQDVTDAVLAKAGSAGGYSITPVVALDVAGSGANAYLGRTRGATIDMARQDQELHTVVVFAKNMAARDAAANASAAGSKVAAGGAFAISVINDGARAHMLADAKANGVYVGAQAGSTLKLVATASAAGGGSGSTGANG